MEHNFTEACAEWYPATCMVKIENASYIAPRMYVYKEYSLQEKSKERRIMVAISMACASASALFLVGGIDVLLRSKAPLASVIFFLGFAACVTVLGRLTKILYPEKWLRIENENALLIAGAMLGCGFQVWQGIWDRDGMWMLFWAACSVACMILLWRWAYVTSRA